MSEIIIAPPVAPLIIAAHRGATLPTWFLVAVLVVIALCAVAVLWVAADEALYQWRRRR